LLLGVSAVGIGIGATDMIVDVVTAPRSARRHNEELRQSRLKLAPAIVGQAPGLSVQTTF